MGANAKSWVVALLSCAAVACAVHSGNRSMMTAWPTPAPATLGAAPVPELPPPPVELAEALATSSLMLKQIALMQASGAPDAKVEESTSNLAGMLMMQLERRLSIEDILPYVRRGVAQWSGSPEVQQVRAVSARMQPFRQALAESPAVTAGLERERANIVQAARLKNDPKTEASGDALHREIAARIAHSAGVPERIALIHVYRAMSKQQMLLAFGPRGPLGAVLQEQAAHAAPPMADVLKKLGTVDLKGLWPAFQRGYAGNPTDVERILRAEFERSEAIGRLQPGQSVDSSELAKTLGVTTTVMHDLAMTMAERNPTHEGVVRLGYEELVAYRAKSPEAERRLAAGLAASSDQPTRDAREKWRSARERIATVALRRAQGVALTKKETEDLRRAKDEDAAMTRVLETLSAAERTADKPFDAAVGVRALQDLLGPNEALLSYVAYGHIPAEESPTKALPRPSYGAFVLTRQGLTFRPLGAAKAVDGASNAFLVAVSDPGAAPEAKREAARGLWRAVFAPLASTLTGVTRLRVVTEGILQGIPLAALRDEAGWLADRLDIRYAFSERQLLGEYVPALEAGEPVVLVPGPYADSPTPFVPGRALTLQSFPELPGSRAEARRVSALLPRARLLTGAQASEGALFSVRSPTVIHIAGHGVFLPPASLAAGGRGVVLASAPNGATQAASAPIDPMIGSALVLNPDAARRNDGFLTAFEVATAPLFGTELVVLSACESGRGNPDRIRGVRGLRQAFFTAGVQSLVVSLWSVSDQATAELMAAFYEKLKSGADRAEALRQASAALRAQHDDPFQWAAFVLLGRDGPIDFNRTSTLAAPQGEDELTRLRRAMTFKRLKRTLDRLGKAEWSSRSGAEQALDAYVRTSQAGPQRSLVLTLLGRHESVTFSVPSYAGPGRYGTEGSRLRAGRSATSDPFKVDIVKLTAEGSEQQAGVATLEVTQDRRAAGLTGTFELHFKDGTASKGSFQLESTEPPALPEPRAQ